MKVGAGTHWLAAGCWLLAASLGSAQALQTQQLIFGGVVYQVVTVDPARDDLRLYWQAPGSGGPLASIQGLRGLLASRGERLLFATNSGIFAPGLKPLGLHVEAGNELRPLNLATRGGNFALLPNGVFWLDRGRAGVTETRAYRKSGLRPDYASQSGPLLVQRGQLHPAFVKGSANLATRSGVGVCAGGVVKFVLSLAPVSFYDFAQVFKERLNCPDALYLDGNLSSFYTPALGDTQLAQYAGMWAVVGK